MFARFENGKIVETDYPESQAFNDERRSWLFVHEGEWHVCLFRQYLTFPDPPLAGPVRAHAEPQGWQWRLELADWHIPLPCGCIHGMRPALPERGTRTETVLHLYKPFLPRPPRQVDIMPEGTSALDRSRVVCQATHYPDGWPGPCRAASVQSAP